uniref:STAC3-related SH3 domain-containing protein n=1 Tax=Caenorhabditis japonica TaxID=281687 RepID=A0A8R1I5X3_CAEJA
MCSRRGRRLSLPQTPMATPANPAQPGIMNGLPFSSGRPHYEQRRQLPALLHPLRHNQSMGCLIPAGGSGYRELPNYHNPHARFSQPDIHSVYRPHNYYSPPVSAGMHHYQYQYQSSGVLPISQHSSPVYMRRMLPNPKSSGGIARKLLKRCTNPDLMRLQRTTEIREQSVGRTSWEPSVVDPVYLALKQATGRYSRRGSSNIESASPSPRNLSQVSLQDSGYAEMGSSKANPLLGSTPQLDNAGRSVGRRRAPKLTQQMKSLSLDCQDMPPRMNQTTRSPLISGSKLMPRDYRKPGGINGSSDFSDIERSCSPVVKSRRSSSSALHAGGYIVIHEYSPNNGAPLSLGEKVRVVDNGDPDWLHGFRYNDRTENMITFPATCVAQMLAGEQAMRIQQNVFVAEHKLRMYRDQIVFVQPESLVDGKVTIRTEHNAIAPCPLSYLALI